MESETTLPIPSRLAVRAARFGRRNRGASAIEFALLAAPMILLLTSMAELGIMYFAEYNLQNAAQEASRGIRTGQITDSGAFIQSLCGKASLAGCASRVGVYVDNADNFATLSANFPDPVSIPASGSATKFAVGGAGKAVVVITTYDWGILNPFLRMASNLPGGDARRLQGIAIFRNENFGG